MAMRKERNLRMGISILLLFVCSLVGYAQENTLSGTWDYKAPSAPYGYETGTIQFKNAEGKLTAIININGSVINVDKLEKKGDVYVCAFSVENNTVKVSFKPEGEKMSAIAMLEDSTDIKVEMTPKKE